MGIISKPEVLNARHQVSDFCCDNTTLDDWLKKRALKNQKRNGSRCFVICTEGKVVGFYALATGSVERLSAPSNFARNMPNPIPVIVLGRLAVDIRYRGRRLGSALLKDAILRTLAVANNVGVRGLLVHAISEDAKRFYLQYGFQESNFDPMTLMISTNALKRHFVED